MSCTTAFEEKLNETHTKMPSFTFCPKQPSHTIKSFEDVMNDINHAKVQYSATLEKDKSFSER